MAQNCQLARKFLAWSLQTYTVHFKNVLNTLQPIISKFIDQKGCNAMFLPQNLFWVQKYLRIEEYPQPPLQTKSRTRHGSMPSDMY